MKTTRRRVRQDAPPLELLPRDRPRPIETPAGRQWHRLIRRHGFGRVAKHATRIARALEHHERPTTNG